MQCFSPGELVYCPPQAQSSQLFTFGVCLSDPDCLGRKISTVLWGLTDCGLGLPSNGLRRKGLSAPHHCGHSRTRFCVRQSWKTACSVGTPGCRCVIAGSHRGFKVSSSFLKTMALHMKIQLLSFCFRKHGKIWTCFSLDTLWLQQSEHWQEKCSLTCRVLLRASCWPRGLQLRKMVCFSRKGPWPGFRRCEPVVVILLLTHCVTLAKSLSLSTP